jgi:hypothetical protein
LDSFWAFRCTKLTFFSPNLRKKYGPQKFRWPLFPGTRKKLRSCSLVHIPHLQPTWLTETKTGFVNIELAKSSIFFGIVAENRRVWHFSRARLISMTWTLKHEIRIPRSQFSNPNRPTQGHAQYLPRNR